MVMHVPQQFSNEQLQKKSIKALIAWAVRLENSVEKMISERDDLEMLAFDEWGRVADGRKARRVESLERKIDVGGWKIEEIKAHVIERLRDQGIDVDDYGLTAEQAEQQALVEFFGVYDGISQELALFSDGSWC